MIEIFKDVIDDSRIYEQMLARLHSLDFPWQKLEDINYTEPGKHRDPGDVCVLDIKDEPLITNAVMDGAMSCFYLLEDSIGDDRRAWNMYRCKVNRTWNTDSNSDHPYLGAHYDQEDPWHQTRCYTCIYYPEDSDGVLTVWRRPANDHSLGREDVARLLAFERPEVLLEIEPRANHMVMFPAGLYHRARAPKHCRSRLAINMVWGHQTSLITTLGSQR